MTVVLRFSHQHGATEVAVHTQQSAKGLELLVQDNGPGISAANAAQLFIPFFTTKRERGGTGLGLTIVQALLRAHHANIEHRAVPKGACFAINFDTERQSRGLAEHTESYC